LRDYRRGDFRLFDQRDEIEHVEQEHYDRVMMRNLVLAVVMLLTAACGDQQTPTGPSGGRVCQVVEKSERVIVPHVIAEYLRRPLHGPHLLPAVHLPELHLAGSQ
jgi:hypothetical protein